MSVYDQDLLEAVTHENYSRVKDLLEKGADPNFVNIREEGNIVRYHEPVLYHACQRKNDRIVELLLNYGADPNQNWMEWSTIGREREPCYFSAFPNLHLTELLLKNGADPTLVSRYSEENTVSSGQSALSRAQNASGNDRALAELIKKYESGEPSDVRKLRVFLCHASGDKAKVRNLYAKLINDGFQPWLDEENLKPGMEWDREIRAEIHATDIVLACLSSASVQRRGYVQKEIKTALDVADEVPPGIVFLIPVRLDECPVPDRLRDWHWVDLFEKRGYSKLRESLQTRAENLIREN